MLPALARQGKREKRRITYLAPPLFFCLSPRISRGVSIGFD
jgi:hypothetical protein